MEKSNFKKSWEYPDSKGWGAVAKRLLKRYFIDAFSGMAQGLFVTLIAGTILKTIGELIGLDNSFGAILYFAGQVASILMGAGIGAGIASHLKAPKMVVFASIVAGFIGAFSNQFIGAGAAFTGGTLSDITALLSKALPGNPIGAYVCSVIAIELSSLVSGKTKLDILLVPLTCMLSSILAAYVAWPFVRFTELLGTWIELATTAQPFVMGVIISVIMGILLTMPTSSAAIWVAIAATNTSDAMLLAGGAAVVGCACQMVGFAVMSYRENGFGGLIAQGLGTSMLQIPNIMKHPKIFIPPIVASAVLGPVSTCVFRLRCNASGGGMGTSGLVGVFGTIDASKGVINDWTLALGIILLLFVLPAVISWAVCLLMRKKGHIKDGDMKLDI